MHPMHPMHKAVHPHFGTVYSLFPFSNFSSPSISPPNMASFGARARRAIASVPFLFIAAWCFRQMDIPKVVEYQDLVVKAGVIEWDGGSVKILDDFFGVDYLNEMWRGVTATFAPSTLAFDSVSWWQVFSFLIDLGPVYAIWILESYRAGSAYGPVYFPTFFTLAGQYVGLGSVAPVYYFLSLAFGPTASDLARLSTEDRTIRNKDTGLLVLIVLLFHTFEAFAMYVSPENETRHYWTWAWQFTPLWIGMANVLISIVTKRLLSNSNVLTSPRLLVALLGAISAGVWGYVLLYSPYPLSTVFLPSNEEKPVGVEHCREALQTDEVSLFSSSFLWLIYSFLDLGFAGLLGSDTLFQIALLPIIAFAGGPGAAFSFGWYVREKALSRPKK